MKVFIKGLNLCAMRRVNVYQYRQALIDAGYEIADNIEEAEKVLVWTCAFRDDYHDNSLDVLKSFEAMGKKVVAAGCLPSINPEAMKKEFKGELVHFKNDREEFKKVFGVDIEEADYPICEKSIEENIHDYRAKNPDMKIVWDDQYIKLFISEGCTKRCSYCTEIRAFGPYQSYPLEKIVNKAKEMVEKTNNYKLAIFGDDIGAWGSDIGSNLPTLVNELIKIHPKIQISLKQINPSYMKKYFNEFIPLIENGKIFQILIPIQSANQRVLDLMERDYSVTDLKYMFDILSKTNVELETHVIAGFPSESKEEWEQTVDFICNNNFRYVMGNIYMPGPGTKAAEMPNQVELVEKERRVITGAEKMKDYGVVMSHSLNELGKTQFTHKKIDLVVW